MVFGKRLRESTHQNRGGHLHVTHVGLMDFDLADYELHFAVVFEFN